MTVRKAPTIVAGHSRTTAIHPSDDGQGGLGQEREVQCLREDRILPKCSLLRTELATPSRFIELFANCWASRRAEHLTLGGGCSRPARQRGEQGHSVSPASVWGGKSWFVILIRRNNNILLYIIYYYIMLITRYNYIKYVTRLSYNLKYEHNM